MTVRTSTGGWDRRPRCARCHRPLTAPGSVATTIGPECFDRLPADVQARVIRAARSAALAVTGDDLDTEAA